MSPIPWLYTCPTWMVALFSAGIGLVVFLVPAGISAYVYGSGFPTLLTAIGSDALAGALSGYASYRIIIFGRQRRAALHARLLLVADLNHHIRNALEIIQLSAYSTQNQDAILQINDAIARIDWTLNDLLGSGEKD